MKPKSLMMLSPSFKNVREDVPTKAMVATKFGNTCGRNNFTFWGNYGKSNALGLQSLATFVMHVVHIVLVCTQKQVVRSNASGIIAFVANIQARIKRAISQFVRNTMRKFPNARITCNHNTTVSAVSAAHFANPIPAGIGFLNLLPKSNFECLSFSHTRTNTSPMKNSQVFYEGA